MDEVQLQLDEKQHGIFYIRHEDDLIGEMEVAIHGNDLTVYHTEVDPKQEGKGYAKKLLEAMVDHARKHQLKVVPLCPYVHAQFKRHPNDYADVWKNPEA